MEFIELPSHPYFVGTQAHPELKSRPLEPHPLFTGFIAAAKRYRQARESAAATPSSADKRLRLLETPTAR